MAICKRCGNAEARFLLAYCKSCEEQVELGRQEEDREGQITGQATATNTEVATAHSAWRGSAVTCITLGIFLLLTGLYFLFYPVANVWPLFGGAERGVVNLQKLTMGETFCIMGAVFLVGGLRPRG